MGNAETFFFDTASLQAGECRVLQHDIDQSEMVPYAESFADFLRKRIRELYRIN
jgi:hypothetical protein